MSATTIPTATPSLFDSPLISEIRRRRLTDDPRKKDLSPTVIDRGVARFLVARHFGFCFGVENAVSIAYRAVQENQGKRIFLVSEMIHNNLVNADLELHGISFLLNTDGSERIPFSELRPDDVVIVPAFGVDLGVMERLKEQGVDTVAYDATCPFVEKVWRRANQLGAQGYSLVVHGKPFHEETRATFSRVVGSAPGGIMVRTLDEVGILCQFIQGEVTESEILERFEGKVSPGFRPALHLMKIGVINQTTMLAEETKEVARMLRQALVSRFGEDLIGEHFADTRDTLCYATSENQNSVKALLQSGADLAIVVGGYNSSNTSNLARILEATMPSYHIQSSADVLSDTELKRVDFYSRSQVVVSPWLPTKRPVTVAVSAGASTPDSLIESVIERIAFVCGAKAHYVGEERSVAPCCN
jgi:4-hydroxy-3-methylbut-2-enyl diphosphate reductase